MEKTLYDQRYAAYAAAAEDRLAVLCEKYLPSDRRIGQAAAYSLLGGGKRVRAVLCLASCELTGGRTEDALDFACALEMLHCYSLIHDDLPCMDNDDMRRGRNSCHKEYDEATALLAADALVTAAFEVIAHAALPAEARVEAAAVLAQAGGARGMLYGQELDKRFETQTADEKQLLDLHRHKTGALIAAAARLGCAASSASVQARDALERYTQAVGLVFQIVDDVLDATATSEELGKPAGSDAANGKTTFVSLYGLEGARALAERYNRDAVDALAGLEEENGFLRKLAEGLLLRRS